MHLSFIWGTANTGPCKREIGDDRAIWGPLSPPPPALVLNLRLPNQTVLESSLSIPLPRLLLDRRPLFPTNRLNPRNMGNYFVIL